MLMAILPVLFLLTQPPAESTELRAVEQLLRQNRYEDAIKELSAALQRQPQSGEAMWLLLARCYENVGRPAEALRTLQSAVGFNPGSQRLSLSLGEVLFRLKADSQEAGVLLAHASEAMPKDPEARHFYAQWAYLNDKEDQCVANERAALALPGLNDLALMQMQTLLGLCEDKLDHTEDAAKAFQQALSINRRLKVFDPASAIQFARFLNVSGKTDQARQLVQEIVSRAPSFGPVHLELAKQLEKSGKFSNAADEARKALAGEGNDHETIRSARSVLAKCLFATGQKKEAEEQRQLIERESKTEPPNQ
jgi:tetratricopeptide (TPR) repeat protein